MYFSSLQINQDDGNLIIGGRAGENVGIYDDGYDDSFVMRLSVTGWPEWYT